jgi:hypothetical protein
MSCCPARRAIRRRPACVKLVSGMLPLPALQPCLAAHDSISSEAVVRPRHGRADTSLASDTGKLPPIREQRSRHPLPITCSLSCLDRCSSDSDFCGCIAITFPCRRRIQFELRIEVPSCINPGALVAPNACPSLRQCHGQPSQSLIAVWEENPGCEKEQSQ